MTMLDPFDFGPPPPDERPTAPPPALVNAVVARLHQQATVKRLLDLSRTPASMPSAYLATIGTWHWHYLYTEFHHTGFGGTE